MSGSGAPFEFRPAAPTGCSTARLSTKSPSWAATNLCTRMPFLISQPSTPSMTAKRSMPCSSAMIQQGSECFVSIDGVEGFAIKKGIRVQGFVAAQLGDFVLNLAVEHPVGAAGRNSNGAPEPDSHIRRMGRQRVERPNAVTAQPQRAEPQRAHPDVIVEPVAEFGQPHGRHLDVLDDPFTTRHRPNPRTVSSTATATSAF